MNRELDYLRIPPDYERNRYSLSWSASGDAIDRPDSTTFAFAAEVALFLEGYASVGRLIHFSYILYLLHRFELRAAAADDTVLSIFGPGRILGERSDALARAFQEVGRPLRNAGALCAWLCRDVPPVLDGPDPVALCRGLSDRTFASWLATRGNRPASDFEIHAVTADPGSSVADPIDGIPPEDDPTSAGLAPLTALGFVRRFLLALETLNQEDVVCWLAHGRGPLPDPGDRVAEVIAALKPKSLESILDVLAARERLAGSLPIVAQLVGALTLPPRKLARHSLPTGGYSDVATRGRPEQILPSQFAIDEMEFLRRFAGNELLYFHREEPQAPITEELILLLDQGVRTWGRVRHALTASAVAFARLAARKKLRLMVGATSTEGRVFDPLATPIDVLGAIWEASDLSPSPSLALEKILERPGTSRIDVVVLSHPRSVADSGFADATRRASPGTRVFSVAIDDPGRVEFREWRRGVPVKVGDFRVDFSPPAPVVRRPSTSLGVDPRGWRGDVEPIPFPFRYGVNQRIDRSLYDFDHANRWLLLGTQRGILHAWKLDGSRAEVLPRAVVGGEVLEQVDAILGVAEGFVVGGRVGKSLVAMHYDFESRTARAHVLGPTFDGQWLWFYSREQHLIVARGKTYSRALDLSTGEVFLSRDSNIRPPVRAIRAFEMASNVLLPPPRLPIVDEGSSEPTKGGFVRLDRATGEIRLSRVAPPWEPFTPRSDGRPTLKDCWVESAQIRGDVLALVVSSSTSRTVLRLFHQGLADEQGTRGVSARELTTTSPDPTSLMLSHDGRYIARPLGDRQVEVRETHGSGHQVLVTVKGRSHSDPRVTLGRYGLLIHVGKYVSLIRWDRDELTVSTVAEGSTRSEHDVMTWPIDRPATRSTPLPAVLGYDNRRFVACARAELTAVVDVFGQVILFDSKGRLIAMFLAFRSQVAAWTPDGTRFGPSRGNAPLLDGPATRNAAESIGRALKAASDSSATPTPDREPQGKK